jgi:hypothetical protein
LDSSLREMTSAGTADRARERTALADVDPLASRFPAQAGSHVQSGGSCSRAVWMARTIVEWRPPVNIGAAGAGVGPSEE